MTTALKHTTAIGSLPHHNVDAALAFSFHFEIPFLPQIPIRNSWEFMIAQALEGLPGLEIDEDGAVTIRSEIWESRTHALKLKLRHAFSVDTGYHEALESFEPSPATSSSWQPFLWELSERNIKVAKIQIAGPLTAQWAIRLKDGSSLDRHPDLTSQIYELVLAKSLAMSTRLKAQGVKPILFLDEPALYCLDLKDPKHVIAFRELQFLIQTLRKNQVQVGIHCCSNTDWSALLSLDLDILSLDVQLSLPGILAGKNLIALKTFIARGGKLSLGVIPTQKEGAEGIHALKADGLFQDMLSTLKLGFGSDLDSLREIDRILSASFLTPACGLALQNVADAELTLGLLQDFNRITQNHLAARNND